MDKLEVGQAVKFTESFKRELGSLLRPSDEKTFTVHSRFHGDVYYLRDGQLMRLIHAKNIERT